jgi:hypothetical protein
MKPHQTAHIHHRYFVFSHEDGDNIKHLRFNDLDGGSRWVTQFEEAHMWSSEADALVQADYWADSMKHSNVKYVVGRVTVSVDGLYAMIVAG